MKIKIIFLFLFLASWIFAEDLKFNSVDDYKISDYKSYKWDFLINSGYKQIDNEDYVKAIENFKKAIDKGCVYPKIYNDTLICFLKIEKFDEGITFVEKYWDKNNLSIAYKILALAYFNVQNYEKSAQYYDKTELKDEGFYKIADSLLNNNKIEDSIKYYEKTSKVKSGYSKVADYYLKDGQFDLALNYYEKSEDPKIGYRKIADKYFTDKIYDKSEIYYEKSGFTQDDYSNLALAFEEIDKIDKAIKYYEKSGNDIKVKDLKYFQEAIKSIKILEKDSNKNFENLSNPYNFDKNNGYYFTKVIPTIWLDEKTVQVYSLQVGFFTGDKRSSYFYIDIGKFKPSDISKNTVMGTDFGQSYILKYDGVYGTSPKFKLLYIYPTGDMSDPNNLLKSIFQ